MKLRSFGKVFDAVLFVMFLVCLGLTYRACRERPVEVTSPAVMETPTPAPTPTPPEPVDPNPERTLILTAMTFFENVANKRFEDAALMFYDEDKQQAWRENLRRVEKFGNPIAAFEVEGFRVAKYCKTDADNDRRARCDFPILLHRRDKGVSQWAAIGMDFIKVEGRWRILYYQQLQLDKEAYNRRKAEEARKREAAELARRKLAQGLLGTQIPGDDDTGAGE